MTLALPSDQGADGGTGGNDRMLKQVSEAFRTPLSTIHGYFQLIETGTFGELNDRGRYLLNIAMRNTDRMIDLVDHLLSIGEMQSGLGQLNKRWKPVSALFADALSSVAPMSCKHELISRCTPQNLQVYADSDRLVQVLVNLLVNAMKFSAAGTEIVLRARKAQGCVQFAVFDQGRGIPPHLLEAIFNPFQQVHPSDSGNENGRGLGLAICRTIVSAHEGTIWAKSVENHGSAFFFRIPNPTYTSENGA